MFKIISLVYCYCWLKIDGEMFKGPLSKRMKTEGKERDRDEHGKDRERMRDKEKERERGERGSPMVPKDSTSHKGTVSACKDKGVSKPVAELDLSGCDLCTPSYRRLPKHVRHFTHFLCCR